MDLKLGKTPARRDAIAMAFGAYFSAAELPTPPLLLGRPQLIRAWGMLGNDKYGDCVWAGAAHETVYLRADAATPIGSNIIPPGASVPAFVNSNVLADYGACTGFKPNFPNSDKGTDVQAAAAYRQKIGIIDVVGDRHLIDVYAALQPANLQQIDLSVDLLGVAGIGVTLPDDAEEQFNYGEVWDIPGPGKSRPSVGGHYVPCIGRNSRGNYLFVSWGKLQAGTPGWVQTYMDEGIAYLSREYLSAQGLSPQGLNLAKLNDDFQQLTGS